MRAPCRSNCSGPLFGGNYHRRPPEGRHSTGSRRLRQEMQMMKLDGWRSRSRSWHAATVASTKVFLRDVGQGLFEVSHNSLALLGLAVVGLALFTAGRADVRHGL